MIEFSSPHRSFYKTPFIYGPELVNGKSPPTGPPVRSSRSCLRQDFRRGLFEAFDTLPSRASGSSTGQASSGLSPSLKLRRTKWRNKTAGQEGAKAPILVQSFACLSVCSFAALSELSYLWQRQMIEMMRPRSGSVMAVPDASQRQPRNTLFGHSSVGRFGKARLETA